jgi:nicotinamidase-related amidase
LDKKNNALIIVDVQKAFDDKKWGEHNKFLAPRGYTIARKEHGFCVKV